MPGNAIALLVMIVVLHMLFAASVRKIDNTCRSSTDMPDDVCALAQHAVVAIQHVNGACALFLRFFYDNRVTLSVLKALGRAVSGVLFGR